MRSAANTTRRSRRCRPERAWGRRVRGGRRCAPAPVTYLDIRGNVDTRLRKRDGDYDAIVPRRPMKRLDLRPVTVPFPLDVLVPAVAQGALSRSRCAWVAASARAQLLNDPQTELRYTGAPFCARARLPDAGWCARRFDGEPSPTRDRRVDGATVVRGDRRITTTSVADGSAAVALAESCWPKAVRRCSHRPGVPGAGDRFYCRAEERPSTCRSSAQAGAEVIEAVDFKRRSRHRPDARRTRSLPSSGSVRAIATYLAERHGAKPIVAVMGPGRRLPHRAGWPPDVVAAATDIPSFVHTVTHFVLSTRRERRRTSRLEPPAACVRRRDARARTRTRVNHDGLVQPCSSSTARTSSTDRLDARSRATGRRRRAQCCELVPGVKAVPVWNSGLRTPSPPAITIPTAWCKRRARSKMRCRRCSSLPSVHCEYTDHGHCGIIGADGTLTTTGRSRSS